MGEVKATKWVAELAISQNGLHEVRAGAANARERPLVGYVTAENRSLIAAAPDLLEALRRIVEADDNAELDQTDIEAARLLIARAEGR